MVPLVALATVFGIAGDIACKAWCDRRAPAPALVAAAAIAWACQSALWFPIFSTAGLARALAASSALYLVGSVAVGILWFGESLSTRQAVGVALALAAVVLVSSGELSAPSGTGEG